MHPLPTAILFDLDDTILDYDTATERSWRAVCQHFSARIRIAPAEELLRKIKNQANWYWSDKERHRKGRLNLQAARLEIVQAVLQGLDIHEPALAEQMVEMRNVMHENGIEPFPGALETVRKLHGAGVRLGMITNGAGEVQGRKIDRFNLRPLFDVIVIEGEFGCGKPDERVFRHALATLKANAKEAWMVGDNLDFDIAPAQAVGIGAIWHDFRGRGLPGDSAVRPDRIIRRLAELVR